MNIIEIAGHLAADPETRFTQSGQKVTSFRVGTRVWKGGKDETIWFRVTVWGDRFDKMLVNMKKGSAIIVLGELAPPQLWTDKEGRTQVSLDVTAEIIKFSPFGKTERSGQEQGSAASHQAPAAPAPAQQHSEPSYGSASYGNVPFAGSGAHAHEGGFSEEEKLPF